MSRTNTVGYISHATYLQLQAAIISLTGIFISLNFTSLPSASNNVTPSLIASPHPHRHPHAIDLIKAHFPRVITEEGEGGLCSILEDEGVGQ